MNVYKVRQTRVDAVCFEGDNLDEVAEFLGVETPEDLDPPLDRVIIELDTGEEEVRVGDYILRGPIGTFEPCAAHVFELFYEPEEL